jgi:hypothetical protein
MWLLHPVPCRIATLKSKNDPYLLKKNIDIILSFIINTGLNIWDTRDIQVCVYVHCACVCVWERERVWVRERGRERERVSRMCVCARTNTIKLFAAHISEVNITFVAIQTPQCHKLFQRELQFAYVPVDAEAWESARVREWVMPLNHITFFTPLSRVISSLISWFVTHFSISYI